MKTDNTPERMIQILLLLGTPYGKSINKLSRIFNVSIRTIERDISRLRKIGFEIELINEDKRYYCIKKHNDYTGDISELLHFTEEEALILNNAINSVDNKNILKDNLLKKLYALSTNKKIKDTITNKANAKNIEKINTAIKEKRKII
ncbi:MAG: HTH domain-containing protein, partial [Bacteroidota bacterium]|nr:HTH domain-containing protein [Bacteroidota bacterium]